ncbi:MAG: helix-turn-helix transcriptional regulator [Thermoanaerobaculia bacterium]|nr:helix-turn-helix transcriptional regulator [Thermoanaerobaculia bacterium]
MSELRELLKADDYSISNWTCDGQDSPQRDEVKSSCEIVFVRSGVFVATSRGDETLLTPNEVWLHPPGLPYRIRHPRGGDACTVLTISEELRDQYAPRIQKRAVAAVTSRIFLVQHRLWSLARRSETSLLEADESVRLILEEIYAHEPLPSMSRRHRLLVRRSQELLAARFTDNLSLRDLAATVGASQYHLSRIFRRGTGHSLHGYQRTLRVRAALSRLAQGESDLTRLALDLGFCDHSHFTRSFARTFGQPPSRWRESKP